MRLHVSPLEVLVFKIHVIFLFGKFGDFAELVHVELPYEGGDMLMPKEVRQYFILEFFSVLNENLTVSIPAQVVIILFFLNSQHNYL